MKRCITCRQIKPIEDYYQNGSGRIKAHCKPCYNKLDYARQKRRKAVVKGELRELSGVGLERSTQALEQHVKDFLTHGKAFTAPVHKTGRLTPFLIGLEFSTSFSGAKILTTRTGHRKDLWDLGNYDVADIAAFLWENHCEVRYDFA